MSGGLMYNKKFLKHICSYEHPESPDRLVSVWDTLTQSGAIAANELIEARQATIPELTRVHLDSYVNQTLERLDDGFGNLDPDTFFSPGTKEAALLAAGGTVDLAKAVWERRIDWGFALPRPPGHHATPNRSMGFCIFNNLAIAAAALLEEGAERILVFDWDVHHGNGTQAIFYDDPRVMFISMHQWPFFPGTGLADEIGTGDGEGYTINIPSPAGCSDEEYMTVMERIFDPMVGEFKPEIIMVSAGFDAYVGDHLAGMRLSLSAYSYLTWKIKEAALTTGRGPCFVLEGGYNLTAVSSGVRQVFDVMAGASPDPSFQNPTPHLRFTDLVDEVIGKLKPYWSSLKA